MYIFAIKITQFHSAQEEGNIEWFFPVTNFEKNKIIEEKEAEIKRLNSLEYTVGYFRINVDEFSREDLMSRDISELAGMTLNDILRIINHTTKC
jgi:hypothetical protein